MEAVLFEDPKKYLLEVIMERSLGVINALIVKLALGINPKYEDLGKPRCIVQATLAGARAGYYPKSWR